jgi:hypothetical protein
VVPDGVHLRLTALLLLAGCSTGPVVEPARPHLEVDGTVRSAPVDGDAAAPSARALPDIVAGQAIEIRTAWTATCEPAKIDKALARLPSIDIDWERRREPEPRGAPQPVVCGETDHAVTVRCSRPCVVDGEVAPPAGHTVAGGVVSVVPLEAGPFEATVVVHLAHESDGLTEVMTGIVRAPDAIGLLCSYPAGLSPCSSQPLPARAAIVVPVAEYRGSLFPVSQGRVNGVVSRWRDGTIALDAVVPDASAAGGVKPGTYALRVEFAGVTDIETVVVR